MPINLNVTTNVYCMEFQYPCQKGKDTKSPFTDNRKSIGCLMLPLTSCTQIKTQMRVFPKIGEPTKWMVYNDIFLRMIWGENPLFWKHPYVPMRMDANLRQWNPNFQSYAEFTVPGSMISSSNVSVVPG